MSAPAPAGRARALLPTTGRSALAGLVGVAAMTQAEQAEQTVTARPDSYVPARTLLGRAPGDGDLPVRWDHAGHRGTGRGTTSH